jgi:hypothetical protein
VTKQEPLEEGRRGRGWKKKKMSFSFYSNSSSSFFSFSTRLRSLGDESTHEDRADLSDATPHPLELKQEPQNSAQKNTTSHPLSLLFCCKRTPNPRSDSFVGERSRCKNNEVPEKLKPNNE